MQYLPLILKYHYYFKKFIISYLLHYNKFTLYFYSLRKKLLLIKILSQFFTDIFYAQELLKIEN